jgi:diaminohydroxyphosphoribosylaminopyrimidine deaminase/5-amino-6-(5-phosphoribosylamino)uracil reductase
MDRALALAARGLGTTNPNPLVGAVLVRDGKVVGEGYHRRAGGPHAEVVALARAGARAPGATLYVNLEPCAHHGRTPPCAPLVARAGVARVVVATRDPNPLVGGKGLLALRRLGVRVEAGVRSAEARALNRPFLEGFSLSRPFVVLKAALTLDGKIAAHAGESGAVTSAGQRRLARRLRGVHDAVAVGIGTVLADDPLLLPAPRPARPFRRIVFDTHLRLPPSSLLARTARLSPVTVVCGPGARGRRALLAAGVEILEAPSGRSGVGLAAALRCLQRMGVRSLVVEGGSALLGSFLDLRILDEVALFRSPTLLGGERSLPAFGGRGAPSLGKALRLRPVPLAQRYPGFPAGSFELFRP